MFTKRINNVYFFSAGSRLGFIQLVELNIYYEGWTKLLKCLPSKDHSNYAVRIQHSQFNKNCAGIDPD